MAKTLFDRALRRYAPATFARRELARAQADGIAQARAIYEGAAKNWRSGGWSPVSTSANAEISRAGAHLREASRDLRRNNATAANIITVIASQVVGAGIEVAFECKRKRVKIKLKELATRHLETTAIDFDGRQNFYGLQGLIIETVAEAGEALVVRYVPPATMRLPVPLQVRVLDPDYLDTTRSGPTAEGGYIYEGIEVDGAGRRVAYWLYDEHPGGSVSWKLPTSHRVSAADVLHIYRQDRPGQMRGVPWLASIIVDLNELRDVKLAELMRYKIAACFAVFLKGASASDNIGQKLANAARDAIGNLVEKLRPGLIQKLPTGVEPVMASPPAVQGFREFTTVHEHAIAAGVGLPHMLVTGNMNEVSFISGRLGLMNLNRNVDRWRWHMMIPHACAGIIGWFLEASTIVIGAGALDDVQTTYTPPRREMVEPTKEVPAMRDAIRAGLTSRRAEVRSLGEDPEQIDAEQVADNARADKDGLLYDSDGRRPLNWKPTPPEKPDGA